MKQTLVNKAKRQKRRGNIVVLAAAMLVVVIAFMAFSIDYGYIVVAEGDLQNAADSAALSGARALGDSREAAIAVAKTWAGKHVAAGEAVEVMDDDVEIGRWDEDTATFTVIPADSPNAVRVTCRRTSGRGNPLRLFFAPVIGSETADLTVTAIGAAALSCGGFVGIEDADVNSGFTDSYDSEQGSYASQVPGDEGHVCSNHDITVKGLINGNASPGTGHSVKIQNGVVTGSTSEHAPKSYDPAEAGDAANFNDNDLISNDYWQNGKLQIATGSVVVFPGGTIYANAASINGELRIEGTTTIYIEEAADISGKGIVNVSTLASDLRIVLLDQSGRVSTFSGQSDLYAVIYGPGADVTTSGNASFFGAVIAAKLKFTNSGGCHFDEALKYDPQFSDAVKLVQ